GRLDAVAGGEFGVFDAERGVLALQQRAALERAPDPGVQLEQPELERHDPDQRERHERDPGTAPNQPVEQPVSRDPLYAGEQAHDKAVAGARIAPGRRDGLAAGRAGYAPWTRGAPERAAGDHGAGAQGRSAHGLSSG